MGGLSACSPTPRYDYVDARTQAQRADACVAQFEPDGTTRAQNGTFTLCKDGKPLHQVVVSLSGRVRSQLPTSQASC